MIYSDLYKDLCQMVQEKKSQHFFMFNSGKYRTNDIRRYKKILYSWVLGIYKKKNHMFGSFYFFLFRFLYMSFVMFESKPLSNLYEDAWSWHAINNVPNVSQRITYRIFFSDRRRKEKKNNFRLQFFFIYTDFFFSLFLR